MFSDINIKKYISILFSSTNQYWQPENETNFSLNGNIAIGHIIEQNFCIEFHYVYSNFIYKQLLIDDIWSESSIWDEKKCKTLPTVKFVIYLCHPKIQLESEYVSIPSNLIISNHFKSVEKRLIHLTTNQLKTLQQRYNSLDLNSLVNFKKDKINNINAIISVITTVYNNAELLEQTIQSVINQSAIDIEYIIKDAGSTDQFHTLIERYKPYLNKVVSIADKGIYFGMHEGILLSTGKYIACLNSDDIFASADVLESIVNIAHPSQDILYGDLYMYKMQHLHLMHANVKRMYRETSVYHPSVFISRLAYFEMGGFDLSYKIAADADLLIKLKKSGKSFRYLQKPISIFRLGGQSTINIKTIKEEFRCRRAYHLFNIRGYIYQLLKSIKWLILNKL